MCAKNNFYSKSFRIFGNFYFRQDFSKKPKMRNMFFGPKTAVCQFSLRAAKNLDKNTPVIRFSDFVQAPDQRYGQSKTGTPKRVFWPYLAQTSKFQKNKKISL